MARRRTVPKRPFIERLWRSNLSWFERALWLPTVPMAELYSTVLAMRAVYWRRRRERVNATTVSVGNLTVGGNGKTPFTAFLARKLAERGLTVGIVSRGYGGRIPRSKAALVSDGRRLLLTPGEAGDEPVMMARTVNLPIAIARRRILGIRLLEQLRPFDTVVLDDAFQHVRLERSFDLLLINAERGLGNGWLLPAGPMRERVSAIRRADAVVLMDSHMFAEPPPAMETAQIRGRNLFRATVRPRSLVRPEMGQWRETPLALVGRRVIAVSGLADANGFYEMIRAHDADLVGVIEYPDHHHYSATDWQEISRAASHADLIITTEKDLVKLERFPFARDSLYALRLEVWMEDQEIGRLLDMIGVTSVKERRVAAG
jgi:tetraacyldisaccharide 4'-kinase